MPSACRSASSGCCCCVINLVSYTSDTACREPNDQAHSDSWPWLCVLWRCFLLFPEGDCRALIQPWNYQEMVLPIYPCALVAGPKMYQSSSLSAIRCNNRSRFVTLSEMSMPGYKSQNGPSKRGTKYFAVVMTAMRSFPALLVPLLCSTQDAAVLAW